jgi:hypothetical protein
MVAVWTAWNVMLPAEMVMYKGSSKKNILKEIKKCDLVCANCHRIRTHERKL